MSETASSNPAAPAASGTSAPEVKPTAAPVAAPSAPSPAPPASEAAPVKPAPAKPAAAPAPKPAPAAPPKAAAPVAATSDEPSRAPAQPVVRIELTPKLLGMVLSILLLMIVFFGGMIAFLVVRLNDRHPMVVDQPPGMDGTTIGVVAKGGGAAKAAVAVAGEAPDAGAGEAAAPEAEENVKIGENHSTGDGKPSQLPGHWPAFRGPNFDNIVPDKVDLANKWPASGPPVLWALDLGEGYAGAAVHQGRAFILDYDQKKKEDALRCFSLEDGKEIWRLSYHVMIKRNHGFSRTVPAVTDKYVVSIGPKCHVMCADTDTGKFRWGIDLLKDYGTEMPKWYTSQCPMIDGTTAIIAPGGKDALIMGVDCETGKVLWKTPNPKGWRMSHSSVVPTTMNGKKMYLYCALEGIVGVATDGTGTVLLESSDWNANVVAPAPVVMDDGHLFLTTGYGKGSMLMKVEPDGDKFKATKLWEKSIKDGVACEQQTPIYYNKHIYSLQPADGGALKDQLVCMNPYDNGKVVWSSGKTKRFGHYEPFLLADGKFYVLSEKGELTVVRATHEKYEELASFKVLHGHDAWGPIALAGGRMLLRDSLKMVCLNVAKGIE